MVAALACISGCATRSTGKISGDYYSPNYGALRCEILGGAKYGRFIEKFSDFGGLVLFTDDMFAYRVDFQTLVNAPRAAFPSQNAQDSQQSDYLHKEAIRLTLKDTPGGVLVSEGARTVNDRRIYFGVLYYPKATFQATLAATGPHFSAIIVYMTQSYAYTVTAEQVDKASLGESREENIEETLKIAAARFNGCTFGLN